MNDNERARLKRISDWVAFNPDQTLIIAAIVTVASFWLGVIARGIFC